MFHFLHPCVTVFALQISFACSIRSLVLFVLPTNLRDKILLYPIHRRRKVEKVSREDLDFCFHSAIK